MASTMVSTSSASQPSTPKTPSNAASQKTVTETPSPGNWKHPRMAEIVRRRKASTFDSSNVLRIACNMAALLASFAASSVLSAYVPIAIATIHNLTSFLGDYQHFPLLIIRLVFLFNIYVACRPLWNEPDLISDIPLTPSQRRLLGLDPGSGKPGTPNTQFVTPPKYKRLTPRSSSPASWNQSRPGSGSGMARADRDGSSPSASPLWAQASKRDFTMERGGAGTSRRVSGFGFDATGASESPARDLLKESSGIWVPSTPSPSGRGNASGVGLNNKWLYERGRSSSGGRRSFGGL